MIRAIILQPTHMQTPFGTIKKSSRLAVLLLLASVAAAGTSACVYRMNIQQGNFLENRLVEQLKVGMTRSQVRYLLGTPMVPDAFDADRWDYLYYFKRGRLHAPEQRLLTVYFKEEKVDRIDHHGTEVTPAQQAAAPPETKSAT
jgi:outer membrane protein assembly factor BamE